MNAGLFGRRRTALRLRQLRKGRVYARSGVSHLWFVDPHARTLTVSRLEKAGGSSSACGVIGARQRGTVDVLELDLTTWWPAP